MQSFAWDDTPTPNGAVLARATNALTALNQGTINLYQLNSQQRSALFAPVPNSLREVLGWFRQQDSSTPTNPDPWATAIYPALSAVDELMAKLIAGDPNVLCASIEIIPLTEEALSTIYDNVQKQLVDDQGNASDPQFWDYSQDFEHAVHLLMAVKNYLSRLIVVA